MDRALEVQGLLAARSQHRVVPLPDLLVAACAERSGLTVLHYNRDYEQIAEITGQPMQWVVPAERSPEEVGRSQAGTST